MINKLIGNLTLSQEDMWSKLYTNYYDRITVSKLGKYIYIKSLKSGLRPLVVAHIDTCNDYGVNYRDIKVKDNIISLKNTASYTCLGGDDRVGVTLMEYLLDLQPNCDYLFTCDEEIGGIGAKGFVDTIDQELVDDISCLIEIDRKGTNHIATYGYDNDELEALIGLPVEQGSYTDLCDICDELGVAGYNIACGYDKQHTIKETININQVNDCLKILLDLLPQLTTTKYECVTYYKSKYNKPKYTEYSYTDVYVDTPKDSSMSYEDDFEFCKWCGEFVHKDDLEANGICKWCIEDDKDYIESYLSVRS